jgi:nucleoside 2-deoxyribosyltransferase
MSKPKVYLCGAISGLTYEQARNDWRKTVREQLSDVAQVLCPMRSTKSLKELGKLVPEGYDGDPLTCSKGITSRDRFDVWRADLVFCNLIGTDRASIGSMIELGWADALRKPIVLCVDVGNVHETHAMVREIVGFTVYSLQDGIDTVRGII